MSPRKDSAIRVVDLTNPVADHANQSSKGHPLKGRLEKRIGGYEKALKNDPKYTMHKPGSENRHK